MRIASSTLYDVNVTTLNQQQVKMLQTQQQVSSGRRIVTPADDPAAAALALDVSQADSANTQHDSNISKAQTAVALSESVMQSVTSLLQDVQSVVVNAGNTGTLSNADRKMLATDLQGRLDDLIVLANHTDATGNYLFSGFQGGTQPFVKTPAGVQYQGDDGQRMIQVSTTGQVAASNSGADIFMRIKNGNGTFVTQADPTTNGGAGNIGTGTISVGSVIDQKQLTGHAYAIKFTSAVAYDVYDTTIDPTMAAAPLSSGNAYVSGQPIQLIAGMQFDIQGTPVSGDQFTVKPSTNESVFKTISDLINTLNTGIDINNAISLTKYTADVGHALNGLSRSLDNVLTVRASMGSRLRQLDAESAMTGDLRLQYQQVLSQLQDVDYNKAITDLTQQKIALEAAQKSFNIVAGLSMFNYM